MSNPSTPLTAESLLAYEPFVRAIAHGLLSNEDEIQDLVQDTWVRALDRPPQQQASLRGWLAAVVRNLARDRHRRDGRRKSRELVAARPEEENVESSFEKLDVYRQVVEVVLALEEPYKTVVILAYYQDLSPARIAERLDRKPATVRSQLHRAHEILRVEMDAEFGGDRRAWAGLLLPVAGLQIGGGTPHVASAQATGFGGAVFKLLVVAAVVAAAIFVPPLFEQEGEIEVGLTESGQVQADARGGAEVLLGQASVPASEERGLGARQVASVETNLTILCLDGQAPIEGVDVWMLDKRTLELDPEFAELLRLIEKSLGPENKVDWVAKIYTKWGSHSVSDAHGEAHFAWSGIQGSVLASNATHKGQLDLTEESAGLIELSIELVSEVAVEVKDKSGRPIFGAPVSVRAHLTEIMSGDIGIQVTEAPGGTTVFRDFVNRIKFVEPGEPTFSVALAIPGMPRQRTSVDPFRGKDDPVQFVIGPTGPLEVRAVNAKGELIEMDGTVQIAERGGLNGDHLTSSKVALEGGIAHFEHVALNTSLEVRLSCPDMGVSWSAIGPGPSQAGVAATIRVVAPGQPVLTGRVLDESGAPLSSTRLHYSVCSQKPAVLQGVVIRTDSDGRFRVELDESVPTNTPVSLRFVRYRDGYDGRVDVPLASLSQSQDLDLGDIVLRDIEGRIRGQVVDSSGEPIVGLKVSVNHDIWQETSGARTDAEGRFDMTAIWPKEPKFSFRSDMWAMPQDLVLLPSAEEHVIVLQRGGRVAGRVLTDDQIDASRVSLVLTDSSDGEVIDWNRRRYGQPKDAGGEFDLGGLAQGNYDLKIWFNDALLQTVERIAVEVGQPSADPRLVALDLRGIFETLELEVLHEDGTAMLHSAMGRVFAEGRRIGWANVEAGKLSLRFPQHSDALVLIDGDGFIPVVIEASAADSKVVLRKGLSVTLHTLQRPASEQAGKRVSLSFRRSGDSRLGDVSHSAMVPGELLSQGSAKVVFPGSGIYELYAAVHEPSRGAGPQLVSAPEKVPGEYSVEVRANDAGGTLDIALPKSFFE